MLVGMVSDRQGIKQALVQLDGHTVSTKPNTTLYTDSIDNNERKNHSVVRLAPESDFPLLKCRKTQKRV